MPQDTSTGVSTGTSGKWHATYWSSLTRCICGSAWAHSSWARSQRVRKRQPLGGSMGEVIADSTSHWTDEDLTALATYLLTE